MREANLRLPQDMGIRTGSRAALQILLTEQAVPAVRRRGIAALCGRLRCRRLIAERYLNVLALITVVTGPLNRNRHGLAGLIILDDVLELISVRDTRAIEGGDDITALKAGLICGTSAHDRVDVDSFRHVVGGSSRCIDGDHLNAEVASLGLAVNLSGRTARELVDNLNDLACRDGVAHALDIRGRVLRDVDADQLTLHVEQAAAGVAGVNGGIGLQKTGHRAAIRGLKVTILRGDDAGGHGLTIAQGVADGDDLIADLNCIGISEGCDADRAQCVTGQIRLLDGQQCDVRIGILTLEGSIGARAVDKLDGDVSSKERL